MSFKVISSNPASALRNGHLAHDVFFKQDIPNGVVIVPGIASNRLQAKYTDAKPCGLVNRTDSEEFFEVMLLKCYFYH